MVLIRKGGIREEDGIFRVEDSKFFLMPTYEHQNPALLQEEFRGLLERMPRPRNPGTVTIDAYSVVENVWRVASEEWLGGFYGEHVWNDTYVQMRFNFNPYDPLYVIALRVYNLPASFELPLLADYEGCRSWVTLDRFLSTAGARPAIEEPEFSARLEAIQGALAQSVVP
jgi:hypothetical protein